MTPKQPSRIASPRGAEGVPLHSLAPHPQIDRYPIIRGSEVTFAYIHGALRLALTGYRANLVDLLGEMLDQEPHGYSALSKRISAISGGRIEVTVPPDLDEAELEKAEEICVAVRSMLSRIPHRAARFSSLAWGLYYGIGAAEISWKRGNGWEVDGLSNIHSRRLSYPNPNAWDLYVWDQGAVGVMPGAYGVRIADYPGKFIVHAPSLRGDYPTREGLGRILVAYFTIKRIVLRVSAQDFERFVKPWVVAYWATNDGKTDMPRSADDADIAAATAAMRGLGAGSLAGVALPDSIKLDLLKATTTLDQKSFLDYLDGAISKACVGQTHTSAPGKSGARAASQVAKEDTLEIARGDAMQFADSIREGLVTPFVALNFPGFDRLVPVVAVHVDKPNAKEAVEIATMLAAFDAPVDADRVAQVTGVPLVPNETGEPRILRPLSPGGSANPVAGAVDETAVDETDAQDALDEGDKADKPTDGEDDSDPDDDEIEADAGNDG